jgi:hypothetical protein
MDDLRSGKEYFDEARIALGYNERLERLSEVDAQMERDYRAEEKEYQRRASDPNRIQSIYESEWHQGFGSECKEHLGKNKDGYYYALELGDSESDLLWEGPYKTKEEARGRSSDAYNEWDERTGEREQAWEDQQIAQFEKRQTRSIGERQAIMARAHSIMVESRQAQGMER